MTFKREMDTTTNPSVYSKARKNALVEKGELSCSHCSYHTGENFDGQKRISKPKSRNTRRTNNSRTV